MTKCAFQLLKTSELKKHIIPESNFAEMMLLSLAQIQAMCLGGESLKKSSGVVWVNSILQKEK